MYWRTLCREQFADVGLPDAAWAFALLLGGGSYRYPHKGDRIEKDLGGKLEIRLVGWRTWKDLKRQIAAYRDLPS